MAPLLLRRLAQKLIQIVDRQFIRQTSAGISHLVILGFIEVQIHQILIAETGFFFKILFLIVVFVERILFVSLFLKIIFLEVVLFIIVEIVFLEIVEIIFRRLLTASSESFLLYRRLRRFLFLQVDAVLIIQFIDLRVPVMEFDQRHKQKIRPMIAPTTNSTGKWLFTKF